MDDKAAKTLLGETFKRQLKMDGGFSTVTFICSKTDDISVMEAADSLGLEEEFEEFESEINGHKADIRKLKKDVKHFEEQRCEAGDTTEAALEESEVWETLKDDLESGKTVFAPSPTTGSKRKRDGDHSSKKSKRRRSASVSDIDSSSSSRSDDDDDLQQNLGDGSDDQIPLTTEKVNAEIERLRQVRRESKEKKLAMTDKIRPIKDQIEKHNELLEAIETEKRSRCIAGQNEYSRDAIRSDYASGIKELDGEIAEEEDAENFDPDEEGRDYEEVARNLPVFCVSSRAYQKLQGRFRQEAVIPGFKTAEDTQIPQLQKHCRELTVKGRSNACQHFLSTLSQLLNSLSIWAANDGTGANLSADHRSREEKHLQKKIKDLESVSTPLVARPRYR